MAKWKEKYKELSLTIKRRDNSPSAHDKFLEKFHSRNHRNLTRTNNLIQKNLDDFGTEQRKLDKMQKNYDDVDESDFACGGHAIVTILEVLEKLREHFVDVCVEPDFNDLYHDLLERPESKHVNPELPLCLSFLVSYNDHGYKVSKD